MKPLVSVRKAGQRGTALFLTLMMACIALATVAAVLKYSSHNARLNYRANQYQRSVVAAEGVTEKVTGAIMRDFMGGGEAAVAANVDVYRQITLTDSDSGYWSDWEFNDASGNAGRTHVQAGVLSNFMVMDSEYAGLVGYVTEYAVVSNARQIDTPQNVIGCVRQDLQLARIPIFQFAMYTTSDMEISCGQPFTITGRVHSNARLYVEPDSVLTFKSRVTAVGEILFQRHPDDCRSAPVGGTIFEMTPETPVSALTLPIGTANTPEAVREIIQPPPPFENPQSPMARQRYYNLVDMVIVVSDSGVTASSGSFNSFATTVPTNELPQFVVTTNSFRDARESKTVRPIDINVGAFKEWCGTNGSVRVALGYKEVSSVYVWDKRTPSKTKLSAVRMSNGKVLPSRGLTVATASPLYVWGHYNQYNDKNLGKADTSTTRPASLVGDAITILSQGWNDAYSASDLSLRPAKPTTVNAAFMAGAVPTANCHYSGGMENFPRFLEGWGSSNPFTYNGSMVKMFPSLYATNVWGMANVYNPPKRDWAFDLNFNHPELLPPLTPGLQKVFRSQWATLAPDEITPSH